MVSRYKVASEGRPLQLATHRFYMKLLISLSWSGTASFFSAESRSYALDGSETLICIDSSKKFPSYSRSIITTVLIKLINGFPFNIYDVLSKSLRH